MKKTKTLSCIFLFLLASNSIFAQWTTRQNFSGGSRSFSTGFAIGTKIYLAGGFDGTSALTDFWEYDIGLNNWSQKTDLPFGFRSGAASFAIGYKGYICTGNNGFAYQNDLWEYDASNDTWAQKASFPGFPRDEAVAFVIGTKAYVGTGQQFIITPNSSFTDVYSDFYEYDSAPDTWTAKADIPGTGRAYAVGVSLGNKGYVGLGSNNDQSAAFNDFYEYDPIADSWTAKNPYPGTGKADAGIFSVGDDIYVLGGINFPSLSVASSCKKYDAIANTWANAANYPGGSIVAPVCVNVADTVFAGTGANAALNPRNDWWRFSPLATSITSIAAKETVVFPNPFSNQIHFQFKNNPDKLRVEIIDMQGKLVYSNLIKNEETEIINTKDLPNGIYNLRVIDSKGVVPLTKKITKN